MAAIQQFNDITKKLKVFWQFKKIKYQFLKETFIVLLFEFRCFDFMFDRGFQCEKFYSLYASFVASKNFKTNS